MAMLLHEIWGERKGLDGPMYASMCIAGTLGAKHRLTLSPFARLLHTFEANSHHEAMVKMHELMKWPAYPGSENPMDRQPYDQFKAMSQQRELAKLKP